MTPYIVITLFQNITNNVILRAQKFKAKTQDPFVKEVAVQGLVELLPLCLFRTLLEIMQLSTKFIVFSTVRKVFKYGVFCGPYFLVFSPNMRKYGPEKTLCLDISHAV